MRYILQHIENIIGNYAGGIPLTHVLKNYYRLHPKLGSRDRRVLSDMAYSWYRCSKGFHPEVAFESKLAACLFLCNESAGKALHHFIPQGWLPHIHESVKHKMGFLTDNGYIFNLAKIAGFEYQLSEGIHKDAWLLSMLVQPLLYIRVRKNIQAVLQRLIQENIEYVQNGNCIGLPNGTNIDKILVADSYVVQDASSQYTGTFFMPAVKERWWDCCAGAGGKSLLLKDAMHDVNLTVTDRRASILHNLAERFKQYHHAMPEQYVIDVADKLQLQQALGGKYFDNIICDVPCTGSGTWARTPEQLYYFNGAQIKEISAAQYAIASNALSYLKPGGKLFYITCSVFAAENEEVAERLQQSPVTLLHKELINGIGNRADSMFIAVLQKRGFSF